MGKRNRYMWEFEMQDVALFFQHAAKCCDWCYIVSLLCIETMYAYEAIFFIHLCNINSLLCKQFRLVPQLSSIIYSGKRFVEVKI